MRLFQRSLALSRRREREQSGSAPHSAPLAAAVALAIMMFASAPGAHAQYQQIPNFTGIGAGYNFRQAINARLGGAAAIAPQIVSSPIANLPPEQDGLLVWCRDCVKTTPCAGGGGGAWALGARGVWSCSGGALEEDLNANGHNLLDAASVNAENAGDINPRESLVAGLGLRMSNGTAAQYTVIDENANVTAHVNGVINVKAPPYNATGNGTTDDWNAIQTAIYGSCGATPPAQPSNASNRPSIYLPYTAACYSISQPLHVTCGNLKIYGPNGDGGGGAAICAQFSGPAIQYQYYAANTQPLVSNVTASWQASHAYTFQPGTVSEIRDSNGNLEMATVSGTSGATQPAWPLTQGTLTTDGTVTWALTVVGGSLATGAGSALDNQINGGNGGLSGPIVNMSYEPATRLTGLTAFTAEAFVEIAQTTTNGGGGQLGQFVGSIPMAPSSAGANTGAFELGATNPSGGHSYGYCEMNTGGTVHTLTGVTPMTPYRTHFEECSYDGANIRLFLDGNLETTQAATGTIQQGYYETVQTTYHGGYWPDQNLSSGGGPEYVDSIRLLNVADHTASYAAPTAKLRSTSNTLILMNFPATAPFGTIQAQSGVGGPANVYLPYQTGATQMGGDEIDAIDFCPGNVGGGGGLYANWIVNSTFKDLSCNSIDLAAFYFNSTDYEDRMINLTANAYPPSSGIAGHTSGGIVIGGQGNDNTYDDLFCSGVTSCVVQLGGSGVYTKPMDSDFSSAVYPFVFEGAQFNLRHPFTDIEDNNANFVSDIYDNGSWAPGLIYGGELDSTSSGGNAGVFTQQGGAPIIDEGTSFGGGSALQIFDILSSPTSPNVLRNPGNINAGVALVNSGHAADVYEVQGNKVTGIPVNAGTVFANFPSPVINGASFYCPDCDPPANPPVACSSVGAKTGAWVHGISNAWICTY